MKPRQIIEENWKKHATSLLRNAENINKFYMGTVNNISNPHKMTKHI